jgi:hypothetical protein
MAKRHAEQIEVALGVAIQPLKEFMKSLQDRDRADLRNEKPMKLLTASIEAMRNIPRLQDAERVARGVRVKDEHAGTPQGGTAIWYVETYQPPRDGPELDLAALYGRAAREWDGDKVNEDEVDCGKWSAASRRWLDWLVPASPAPN